MSGVEDRHVAGGSPARRDPDPRAQRAAWIVGGVGAVALLIGLFVTPTQFFQSYLFGAFFWLGVTLGCFALLMLQGLTGATWGYVIRPPLEAATRVLPVVAILFLPILLGVRQLYPWAVPGAAAHDHLIAHKAPYLNIPFWALRTVGYFAVWIGILQLWYARARRADAEDTWLARRKVRVVSGPAILVYGSTVTLASVDWVMSLEPHWFSTIFGVLVIGGQVLSAMSFILALSLVFAGAPPEGLEVRQRHDLGNFLLVFVALWTYFSFSQYIIIYSGNMTHDIPWYVYRTRGGWQVIAVSLIVLHFAVPFAVLLSRKAKRSARILAVVAAGIFVMRIVEVFWMIAPSFHQGRFAIHWLDFAALLGIGGIWMAFFLRQRGLTPRPAPIAAHGH